METASLRCTDVSFGCGFIMMTLWIPSICQTYVLRLAKGKTGDIKCLLFSVFVTISQGDLL